MLAGRVGHLRLNETAGSARLPTQGGILFYTFIYVFFISFLFYIVYVLLLCN